MNTKKILEFILQISSELAARSENKIDDAVVALAKAIYESDLLSDWLERSGGSIQPGVLTVITEPSEEIKQEFAAKGIPWDRAAELLPNLITLIQLIRTLFGR